MYAGRAAAVEEWSLGWLMEKRLIEHQQAIGAQGVRLDKSALTRLSYPSASTRTNVASASNSPSWTWAGSSCGPAARSGTKRLPDNHGAVPSS
jgi:hypothetical protein